MKCKAEMPDEGFVLLSSIIAPGPIPVSKSTWWAGVKSGRFPKPVKLGPRIRAWRVEEIRALIERLGQSDSSALNPVALERDGAAQADGS